MGMGHGLYWVVSCRFYLYSIGQPSQGKTILQITPIRYKIPRVLETRILLQHSTQPLPLLAANVYSTYISSKIVQHFSQDCYYHTGATMSFQCTIGCYITVCIFTLYQSLSISISWLYQSLSISISWLYKSLSISISWLYQSLKQYSLQGKITLTIFFGWIKDLGHINVIKLFG